MKKLYLIGILMVITVGLSANSGSVEPEKIEITFGLVMAVLAGIYEVLSRFIKTSKTWSIIGKILEVLTWLSNLLDRKKLVK